MTNDAEDDAVAVRRVRETGHGPGAAAHLPEGALDDIGGADLAPVGRRKSGEGQQLLQVPLYAGDRPRTPGAPLTCPAPESPLGLSATAGLIHRRRLTHIS